MGLNAILHAAGVPKGSFYYFFKSKEDFARAVLDVYERRANEQQDAIFKDTSRSPMQRLRDYFDEIGRGHLAEAPLGGCLFGVLSQTAAARSAEFKARLAQVFSTWEADLAELLEEAKSVGEVEPGLDTREAAAFLIDSFEGMLVRLKIDGNRDALGRFQRMALEPLAIKRQV